MTTRRTGGRILVDNLLAQGCDRIFQVPGESFLAVLDALHDTPAIDVVTCPAGGGAAFMACADASMTGRPGVCFVTRGPGATNASIGVHVAMQDSIPMLLCIGDVDRGMRDREGFQEVDLPAMFAPLAKWATRIEDAARIPEYVARAWNVAMSGRPGPVVVALPEDMLRDAVEAVDRPANWPTRQPPHAAQVDEVLAELARARAPVAIVGGAGWRPEDGRRFAEFAERCALPVAGAFRRQDAFPQHFARLGRQPRLRPQSRAGRADRGGRPAAGRRRTARRGDHGRLCPDHPRPSRPGAGPCPPRPVRAQPGLSRRLADLRRHGRIHCRARRVRRRPAPLRRRRRTRRMARMVHSPPRARP